MHCVLHGLSFCRILKNVLLIEETNLLYETKRSVLESIYINLLKRLMPYLRVHFINCVLLHAMLHGHVWNYN